MGAVSNDKATVPSSSAKEILFSQQKAGLSDYWFQGKAEINRYELWQNRYQDVHPGEAVLIFVTEDFLTDQQTKNDRYRNPNSTLVLKNNALRRFTTGIYDYSIMSSVFTPVETNQYPATLKVSMSSQEWCGQVYAQLNFREQKYELSGHSYFEGEADENKQVGTGILEDELLNRIRMDWQSLPTGRHQLIPALFYARLQHKRLQVYAADLSVENYIGSDFTGNQLKSFRINYPELKREVSYVFESESPYKIVGWTETYPSAFDKELRTTIAKLTHQQMTPYWQQNALQDTGIRKDLGLESWQGK